MGQEQLHGLGYNQQYYAEVESTYATFVRPTATGAFNALSVSIERKQAQRPRRDNRGVRGDYELVLGDREVTWSVKGLVIPSGTAGTAPDMGALYMLAMGASANSPATSETYSHSSTQGAHGSITLHRWSDVLMEAATGCFCEDFKIAISGSDEPTVEFSGIAASYVMTGCSTLAAAMVATDQMNVVDNESSAFMTNSIVQIGADTNSGVGYLISDDSDPFTIQSSISASNGADVLPYAPTPTLAGSPANGISGSFSLDATTIVPVTAFEYNVKNNMNAHRYALNPTVGDYTEGYREVTGSITIKLRRDQVHHLGRRLNAITTARDIAVVIGDTAGSICTINVDRARFDGSAINFPDSGEEADVQIPWRALASARTTNNESTIVFT